MFNSSNRILQQLCHLVKDKPDTVVQRIASVMTSQKSLEKESSQLKTKLAEMQADGSGGQAVAINGVTTIIRTGDR